MAWIQNHNATLSAVAALCAVSSQQKRPFLCNPRVQAMVDFNVDSILREYVQALYGGPPLVRTIERASKDRDRDKISVYHMHGNLRFDPKQGKLSKEAPDKLVLTEEDYFDFFNSPTSLFNYTFLSLLREHSFLFVGLSMQDDNIRRLLHYSTREREQGLREEHDRGVEHAIRHFVILKRSETEHFNIAGEKTLRRLGTRVLWVRDHAETPPRLGNMYEPVAGLGATCTSAGYQVSCASG